MYVGRGSSWGVECVDRPHEVPEAPVRACGAAPNKGNVARQGQAAARLQVSAQLSACAARWRGCAPLTVWCCRGQPLCPPPTPPPPPTPTTTTGHRGAHLGGRRLQEQHRGSQGQHPHQGGGPRGEREGGARAAGRAGGGGGGQQVGRWPGLGHEGRGRGVWQASRASRGTAHVCGGAEGKGPSRVAC